ncbi:MAG: hypothetical protein AAF649_07060 [Verrucomicrobiota bacterium]
MTRTQFLVLMGAAVVLILLLLVKVLLIRNTHELSIELAQSQQEIMQGQAARPLLNGITNRLMRGTATEPDLADLLRQYDLYPTGSRHE